MDVSKTSQERHLSSGHWGEKCLKKYLTEFAALTDVQIASLLIDDLDLWDHYSSGSPYINQLTKLAERPPKMIFLFMKTKHYARHVYRSL